MINPILDDIIFSRVLCTCLGFWCSKDIGRYHHELKLVNITCRTGDWTALIKVGCESRAFPFAPDGSLGLGKIMGQGVSEVVRGYEGYGKGIVARGQV